MQLDQTRELKIRQALRLAQVACMFLGTALLLWGLAPAIVQRVVSGRTPPSATFTMGAVTMVLGVGFLTLSVLISRALIWALWATVLLAFGLVFAAVTTALVNGTGLPSLAPLLLAGGTAVTSWLAIGTLKSEQRAKRASRLTRAPITTRQD